MRATDETGPLSPWEVIMGTPALKSTVRELAAPARWYRYFHQGRYWVPHGKPPVEISTMDPEWRLNCTRYLVRRADRYARAYVDGCHGWLLVQQLGGADDGTMGPIEDELDHRASAAGADPAAWIVTTELYKALAYGLPAKGAGLRHLAERAQHWDGCKRRQARRGECTCTDLAAAEERRREALDAALGEGRAPEWTDD